MEAPVLIRGTKDIPSSHSIIDTLSIYYSL